MKSSMASNFFAFAAISKMYTIRQYSIKSPSNLGQTTVYQTTIVPDTKSSTHSLMVVTAWRQTKVFLSKWHYNRPPIEIRRVGDPP
ncbi:hypothetical protein COCNU_05G004810 [Cocos nucifera]|uniref:Uncharacterized protein n=1 Tax=Cocos nucifera TaxID=13894 RepID=A0A8K0N191_COCNU|nr:hypothetical protein COCNU_05G004810 [Cocos nucifera]